MDDEEGLANGPKKHRGDETEPGSKQSADGICPKCGGFGRLDGKSCSNCGGDGIVTVIVGDA
jgi:DnaJ-class molecular chaperone